MKTKSLTHIFLLLGLLIALVLSIIGIIYSTDSIDYDATFGDTQIAINADRSWLLTPLNCIGYEWIVIDAQAIYVNQVEANATSRLKLCGSDAITSEFRIVDSYGVERLIKPQVFVLTNLIFYLLAFAGSAYIIITMAYFLYFHQPRSTFPIIPSLITILALMLISMGVRNATPIAVPEINIAQSDLAVSFSADKSTLVLPDECTTLRWSVVNADVTFNDRNVPNTSTSRHCVDDGTIATLEIIKSDGQLETLTLRIDHYGFANIDTATLVWVISIAVFVIASIIYTPLIVKKLRLVNQGSNWLDLLIIFTFLLYILFLYIPFGVNSIGHWEEWIVRAFLQGEANPILAAEFISRLLVLFPHTVANIISPDTFIGFHLITILFLVTKMIFFYGTLRLLSLSRLFAYITTVIFMVYPVNTDLMSLRSFPMHFSAFGLLLAIYLMLDYRHHPTRLKLAGIWLALAINVFSNEFAYLIILFIPILWWIEERKFTWCNFNLSVIWYLIPTFKVTYLILLLSQNRSFYLSNRISSEISEPLHIVIPNMLLSVMDITFLDGLLSLYTHFRVPDFTVISLIATGLIALISWIIEQYDQPKETSFKLYGKMLLIGIIFLPLSVGILGLIPHYRHGLWRMYFFVPFCAALIVTSIWFIFFTQFFKKRYLRQLIIIGLASLFIFPATMRLFKQHNHFIADANNKEIIIDNLLEIMPNPNNNTHILITTDLNQWELSQLGVWELMSSYVLDSVAYLKYEENNRPASIYVCMNRNWCSTSDNLFNSSDMAQVLTYTQVLVLSEDLSLKKGDVSDIPEPDSP